jgi:hypothetical protein
MHAFSPVTPTCWSRRRSSSRARHPASQHTDRARGRTRARAAYRSAAGSAIDGRPRVPLLRHLGADRRGPAHSRRSPTTRSSARDPTRCATSRSALATCSVPSSRATSPRSARAYVEMLNGPSRSSPPGADGRGGSTRVDATSRHLCAGRGAQDRPPPPDALAEYDDEPGSPRGDRGSLRAAADRSRTFSASRRRSSRSRSGADYLIFRGGRATVGPVGLAASELRALRAIAEAAVYIRPCRDPADGLDKAAGRCYRCRRRAA